MTNTYKENDYVKENTHVEENDVEENDVEENDVEENDVEENDVEENDVEENDVEENNDEEENNNVENNDEEDNGVEENNDEEEDNGVEENTEEKESEHIDITDIFGGSELFSPFTDSYTYDEGTQLYGERIQYYGEKKRHTQPDSPSLEDFVCKKMAAVSFSVCKTESPYISSHINEDLHYSYGSPDSFLEETAFIDEWVRKKENKKKSLTPVFDVVELENIPIVSSEKEKVKENVNVNEKEKEKENVNVNVNVNEKGEGEREGEGDVCWREVGMNVLTSIIRQRKSRNLLAEKYTFREDEISHKEEEIAKLRHTRQQLHLLHQRENPDYSLLAQLHTTTTEATTTHINRLCERKLAAFRDLHDNILYFTDPLKDDVERNRIRGIQHLRVARANMKYAVYLCDDDVREKKGSRVHWADDSGCCLVDVDTHKPSSSSFSSLPITTKQQKIMNMRNM
jgi:hypothetical protein